mmetsp:Transcript_14761/g.31649  ORF Transcript_14761/g.31649 Transcript_14761/m.31649 type:complete len:122 (-) Transcript_14761:112-477(-)
MNLASAVSELRASDMAEAAPAPFETGSSSRSTCRLMQSKRQLFACATDADGPQYVRLPCSSDESRRVVALVALPGASADRSVRSALETLDVPQVWRRLVHNRKSTGVVLLPRFKVDDRQSH